MSMEWIPLGRVNRTHGLKGELKFAPLDDDGQVLESLDRVMLGDAQEELKEFRVESLRGVPGSRIIKFSGLDSVEEAKALTGETLYRHRDDFDRLPAGEYYRFEIEGLKAYDDDGKYYGRVVEIIATGSNDVYVVQDEDRELLLPMVDSVVHRIDLEQGKLTFHVVEGLIEDASV